MINYCFDYYKIDGTFVDEGTMVFDTRTERNEILSNMAEEDYTISEVYEDEDCYCAARYEGECACGNFR